jgi:hypothetical protein
MNDKSRNLYFLRTIDALNFAKFEIDKLAPLKSVVNVPLAKINEPHSTARRCCSLPQGNRAV